MYAHVVDRLEQEILVRFVARADEIADEIAAANISEVEGFRQLNDALLFDEIRALARAHVDAFAETMRTGGPPPPELMDAVRARAEQRARELVPLSPLVQSYLIAQRVIGAAIAREASPNARSREAALQLTERTFDYNLAVTKAMADAYIEAVQGEVAELESARRGLVEALLSDADAWQALTRRAIGLGFDSDREYAVAVAVVDMTERDDPSVGSLRWAAQAIARSSGRPERTAFVVGREHELIALLDAAGSHPAARVLERAAKVVASTHGARLRAGIGPAFRGLGGFCDSYREARRALKHTTAQRPFVLGPADVLLFDELTSSLREHADGLIPGATRRALADRTMRETIEAFFEADLQVSVAARALALHPNSLRYRLARIAELTDRDPRKLADLLELIAAVRVLAYGDGADPALTAS